MFSTEAVGSVACGGFRPLKPGSWWRIGSPAVFTIRLLARDRAYGLFRALIRLRPSRSEATAGEAALFPRACATGVVMSMHVKASIPPDELEVYSRGWSTDPSPRQIRERIIKVRELRKQQLSRSTDEGKRDATRSRVAQRLMMHTSPELQTAAARKNNPHRYRPRFGKDQCGLVNSAKKTSRTGAEGTSAT